MATTTPPPTSYPISPGNDKTFSVTLATIPDGTVTAAPLLTGTASAFLATTDGDTATAADPSLVASVEHVSGDTAGVWRIAFDDSVLDPAVMDPIFAATPTACFCIVNHDSGIRVVIPLIYTPARLATLS